MTTTSPHFSSQLDQRIQSDAKPNFPSTSKTKDQTLLIYPNPSTKPFKKSVGSDSSHQPEKAKSKPVFIPKNAFFASYSTQESNSSYALATSPIFYHPENESSTKFSSNKTKHTNQQNERLSTNNKKKNKKKKDSDLNQKRTHHMEKMSRERNPSEDWKSFKKSYNAVPFDYTELNKNTLNKQTQTSNERNIFKKQLQFVPKSQSSAIATSTPIQTQHTTNNTEQKSNPFKS
jgi:hypothetical protein